MSRKRYQWQSGDGYGESPSHETRREIRAKGGAYNRRELEPGTRREIRARTRKGWKQ